MTGKHSKDRCRTGMDRLGRSALHDAANDGDAELVDRLLKSGHNPNLPDDNGWTALHFAAQRHDVEAVRLLLAAGASANARDARGNTPLSTAVFNSRGRGEIIELLRAHGADPHARNESGVSPLNLARKIANLDVRQLFADLPEATEDR